MNILRSNDVKRINKIVIRKALLELRSATRKELMEATGISSSSIGSLIMEMVRDEDILEESIDSSTGGRCPMRYALNYYEYRVMCILIDREHANVHIIDCLEQEVHKETMSLQSIDQLKQTIIALSEAYHVKSINVSIPGIIQGDRVLQDSETGLQELNFLHELHEELKLPLYLENDVKCMVQGYIKTHEDCETISYLYLSTEGGLGCASVNEGHLIQGSDHLAGEIGLLKYNGSSMNNLLRKHPDETQTLQILTRLISVLVCAINPSLIVLSGVDQAYEARLRQAVEEVVSDRFTLRFVFDEHTTHHIIKALWSHALDVLLHENDQKNEKND